jgi:hypothetical protein
VRNESAPDGANPLTKHAISFSTFKQPLSRRDRHVHADCEAKGHHRQLLSDKATLHARTHACV